VSRPGVLFCDINAAANEAKTSADPSVIRFDIVKAVDHFSIKAGMRKFYQAEVLVPLCIPPHLIRIPDADISGHALVPKAIPTLKVIPAKEDRSQSPKPQVAPEEKSPSELVTPESSVVKQAVICEMPFSTSTLLLTAAGGGSSTLSTPSPPFSQTPACLTKEDESAQLSRIDLELGAPIVVVDPKQPAGLASTPASVTSYETKALALSPALNACARGGVLNIKGDHNDCCYHLAGVIGTLCSDPNALSTGRTACSKTDLAQAREKIVQNLSRWRKAKRDWCCSEAELEVHTRNLLGETFGAFVTRASGKAQGANRMGSNTDLALYTLYDNVQVVVVNARGILRDSSEKALRQAVVTAGSGDQGAHDELGCTKSKFVCAILSEFHFPLGVVKSPDIRAIFNEGHDWDEALHMILDYVRSRAPVQAGQKPRPLSSVWTDPCPPCSRKTR